MTDELVPITRSASGLNGRIKSQMIRNFLHTKFFEHVRRLIEIVTKCTKIKTLCTYG